ncbi:AzlC family ABC transporter permease [uncultured Holdemanella sp.]|uniref:AzlC family ABC transporter permease n=1 Tax=uncultured Holdemanella sp. TaxID=1763549 RepID=UPI00341F9C88
MELFIICVYRSWTNGCCHNVSLKCAYVTIVFTVFILYLRHIIMSTCIMEKMEKTSLPIRLLLSFGLTDEVFAMSITDKKINKLTPSFFAGLALFSYLSWNVGSALGIVFSSILPSIVSKSLGVSLYAMFIGLLVPNMKKSIRLLYVVILTMIVNWVLNQFLSSSLSMLISTLGCALIGMCFISKEDLQ